MKPLGRKTIKFPSKENINFKDSSVQNWWEDIATPCKKSERRRVKNNLSKYKGKNIMALR